MPTVTLDVSDDEIFEERKFPVIEPPGKYEFEIANDLKVEPCKEPSENSLIAVEFKCLDDGANKGKPLYDNIVLFADTSTEKAKKGAAIHRQKLAHLTMAAGVMTKEEIKASGGQIPLEEFKGRVVTIDVTTGIEEDQNGKKVKRSSVRAYCFKQEES